MNISLPAIKMLGDMLTEQEERINDANPATDKQLELDLKAVNELWQLYQLTMPNLEMLTSREQLMEDVTCIIESKLPDQDDLAIEVIASVCDSICEHFPAES
jgi:hypothetical protein